MAFETCKNLTGFQPESNGVFSFEKAIEDWKDPERKKAILNMNF